jgi:hypothetical protein
MAEGHQPVELTVKAFTQRIYLPLLWRIALNCPEE